MIRMGLFLTIIMVTINAAIGAKTNKPQTELGSINSIIFIEPISKIVIIPRIEREVAIIETINPPKDCKSIPNIETFSTSTSAVAPTSWN